MPRATASRSTTRRTATSRSSTRRSTRRSSGQTRPSGCRSLILLDQQPMRQGEVKECRRLIRTLEREKEKLETFRTQDQPTFTRWLAKLFGDRQTELRELSEALEEKTRWLKAIYFEMSLTDCSPQEAYQTVKILFETGKHPDAEEPDQEEPEMEEDPFKRPDDEEDPFKNASEAAKDGPLEERLAFYRKDTRRQTFNSILRMLYGVERKELSKQDYDRLYDEYCRDIQMFYGLTDEEVGRTGNVGGEPDPAKTLTQRCKELYRALVRRLHPDLRADSDAAVSQVWHEIQEAYDRQDVERLQMLSALADVHDSVDGTSTIWELRQVQEELNGSVRSIRRELRRARKQPEWRFTAKGEIDRNKIAEKLEATLEEELADKRGELKLLTHQLNKFSEPPKQRSQPRRRQRARAANHDDIPF